MPVVCRYTHNNNNNNCNYYFTTLIVDVRCLFVTRVLYRMLITILSRNVVAAKCVGKCRVITARVHDRIASTASTRIALVKFRSRRRCRCRCQTARGWREIAITTDDRAMHTIHQTNIIAIGRLYHNNNNVYVLLRDSSARVNLRVLGEPNV